MAPPVLNAGTTMKLASSLPLGVALLAFGAGSLTVAQAATIDPFYAPSYSMTDLGSISGLPGPYGGLTVLAGDTNTLLIGGNANNSSGAIYSVGVNRDIDGHITGFSSGATLFSTAPYIDGGLSYGPDGVLFYAGYPTNQLGQIKPGSTTPDKIIDLADFGVTGSVGSMMFVPTGQPGAGLLKAVSYSTGAWYTLGLTPDGSGTFDVTSATYVTTIGGGPEGIAYVPTGSALFSSPSILVAEWGAGNVVSYEVDANGDPILSSKKMFISGLSGAEGALIDPVTGDFLFSTFGGGDHVVRVSGGFVAPPPPTGVPDGGSVVMLFGAALGALVALRRRCA